MIRLRILLHKTSVKKLLSSESDLPLNNRIKWKKSSSLRKIDYANIENNLQQYLLMADSRILNKQSWFLKPF